MGGSIRFYETFIWKFFENYFPYIFSLIIFWLLYYIPPNIRVSKRAAFIGALPASVAWNLLTSGFSWFLRSGFVRYEIVYGSLSTIVSLLVWIYFSNLILLLGAYISGSAQTRLYPKKN
jgi:membrane protein